MIFSTLFEVTHLNHKELEHSHVRRKDRRESHQGDEVGEGQLELHLSDVVVLLCGTDVLVVAFHQIPQEQPL